MKICLYHSKIKYIPKHDELLLTEKDIHPCEPFFIKHDIKPESIDKINTRGIFETAKYIRDILKIIDYLLKKDGELYIDFFRASFDGGGYPLRPLAYLMNEISTCYRNRYEVIKKKNENDIDSLTLKKGMLTLPKEDTIDRWSFGIVSDGRKNERIMRLIEQIRRFKIPEYEVIICGPSPFINVPSDVRILDDSSFYHDLRIPISRKKNYIIDEAKYNNLVIMHDRITFASSWYEKMVKYGNYFDQLCFPILDEETKSMRVNDWMKSSHDFTEFEKVLTYKLSYNEWDRHIYVDGGFMLIKKHLIENIKLNPFLNWGELEDVDLSERLYLSGNFIGFYADTFLLTQTHRIKGSKTHDTIIAKFIHKIKYKKYLFVKKIKIKRHYNKYLRKVFI